MNKIFKNFFMVFVCVVLAIPTNAAVSVSDGSAFVTKAEFSADLNNLSNRMAQLENSLDSKIDSLVSTYLSRNGIWNGAIQNTQNYTIKYKDLLNPIKTAMTTICGRTDAYASSEASIISWTCVPKCNKSGLLVLSVNCDHSWNYTMNQDQGAYKHSIWQGAFSGYIEVDKKISSNNYEMLGTTLGAISCFQEYYYWGVYKENPYVTISVPNAVYNIQVFVSKDDEINSKLMITYSGRKSGAINFDFNPAYDYACTVDKQIVGSATSTLSSTDLTWVCSAVIY